MFVPFFIQYTRLVCELVDHLDSNGFRFRKSPYDFMCNDRYFGALSDLHWFNDPQPRELLFCLGLRHAAIVTGTAVKSSQTLGKFW